MVTSKNHGGLLLATILLAALVVGATQQNQHHDRRRDHERMNGVNKRGDEAMEFSHAKTRHHFRLTPDGGTIEVTANDPSDFASQRQINTHLQDVAKQFKAGDFNKPMFIHGEEPPGVPAMKRFKSDITYTSETITHGARVRISSTRVDAVDAIHEFLRYQIKDHQTGDSLEISRDEK